MSDTHLIPTSTPVEVSHVTNWTRTKASVIGDSTGGYVMSWTQATWPGPSSEEIYYQFFNADGTENGAAVQVNSTTADVQNNSSIAVLNNGDIVIAWDSANQDGDLTGVYMQRYDAAGVAQGGETLVNTTTTGDQSEPAVLATSDGGFVILWTDNSSSGPDSTASVVMQRYNSNGTTNGSETILATETTTNNLSYGSVQVVELTGGDLAVGWERTDQDTDYTPQLGIYTIAGVQVAPPVNPQVTPDKPLTLPQTQMVELGNGDVLVAWITSSDENTGAVNVGYGEIYGRIYDATGAAVTGEITIATGTDNRRFDLFAESDGNGGALVGFVQEAAEVNERAILVQNVAQDGQLLGEPIWINQNATGQAKFGAMGLVQNGDVITAYHDGGPGALSDVFHHKLINGADGRFTTAADTVVLLNTGESVAALGGNDTVTGGTGNDAIGGGSGDDNVDGGNGDDVIQGEAGADDLDGGIGDDTVIGGSGDDTLAGSGGSDSIDGGLGNDTIDGGTEADLIHGGGGADSIDGGDGNDTVFGLRQAFADAGPGEDDKDAGFVNTLNGGAGNDSIRGGEGTDIINGGDGNDTMFGDESNSSTGDDTFIASNGTDLMNGSGGFNTADYSGMGGEIDVLFRRFPGTSNTSGEAIIAANGGNPQYTHTWFFIDKLIATAFADDVLGDDEDNDIEGGAGADTLDGGLGSDTVSYASSSAAVNVDIAGSTATGGHATGDVISNFENATGSAHNDTIAGDGNANILHDGDGGDDVDGAAGNDRIVAGDGLNNGDTLDGGAGTDTIDFSELTLALGSAINIRSGRFVAALGGAEDLLNFEHADGSQGDETINGSTGDNVLNALAGNDTVNASGGNDTVDGGDGNDSILGGQGNDSLTGGDGDDTINGQAGEDTIDGGLGNDSLLGSFVNDTLDGGDGNDFMDGGALDDIVNGDAGDDTINGVTGNDSLSGGADNDELRAGKGNDTLDGGDGNDLLAGADNADTLIGGNGNDTLQGQGSLDELDGGAGDDVLVGGDNADTFIFGDGYGNDSINDFADDQDILQLDDALWVGVLTAQNVVDTFAAVVGNHTVFTFDNGTLTVKQFTVKDDLVDDIIIV